MTTSEKVTQTLRDSAGVRWMVLLFLAFAMFCSYIFMDILSPIKDLMLSTRGWDSTAFGTMQGSETFLNVFVFFLIFAGIILDKMGVRFTAILSGAVMLAGFKNSDGKLDDPGTKADTYKLSKEMVARFQEKTGSTVCKELKGIETGKVLCSCPDCIRCGVEVVQEVLEL